MLKYVPEFAVEHKNGQKWQNAVKNFSAILVNDCVLVINIKPYVS